MLDLFSPMGSVLLSWLLLFLLFSGLGVTATKLLGQPLATGWVWLDAFWFGWALSIGVLQLWHFAFPVSDTILLLFAGAAILLLFSQRRRIASIIGRLRNDRFFVAVFVVIALWMSNRALGMPIAYDSGFRDIQAVMWIDSYPIVPGLGNLFSSLAFNHSVYLYDALLDASIWSGRSHYIATGLLMMVYLAYAVKAALKLFQCRSLDVLRWSWIFATLTIPYILFNTVSWGGIAHFLTDTVVDLVGFLSMIYMLDFLQDWDPRNGRTNYLVYRLAIIILTGFTIKQSFIVFGLCLGVFVFSVWLQRSGIGPVRERGARLVLSLAIVAFVLVIPWMARGVITSGYIAFPQTLGRFDVDWAISVKQLQDRQLVMSVNTRLRGGDQEQVLESWGWLRSWLQRFARNYFPSMMPTVIAIGALCLYAAGRLRYLGAKQARSPGVWVLTPLLAMLTFWFFSFPEPKYVRYVFWSLAALSVILAFLAWHTVACRQRIYAVYVLAAVCLVYVAILIIRQGTYPLPAGPDEGFYAHWTVPYDEFKTDSGLSLNVPEGGASQCWHTPLPCTAFPDKNLEARVPGDLRHGFKVDGKDDLNSTDS